MTCATILAATKESGFDLEPNSSVWTVSLWHQDARARFTAQRTTDGGWCFHLVYAGSIHVVEPLDGADLIRILTDTLGMDVRSRSGAAHEDR